MRRLAGAVRATADRLDILINNAGIGTAGPRQDPRSLSVTLGGAPEDLDLLKRNRDIGITRMNLRLPPAEADEILPLLDRWAKLIPQLRP